MRPPRCVLLGLLLAWLLLTCCLFSASSRPQRRFPLRLAPPRSPALRHAATAADSPPHAVWIQHVQRAAGSWLCRTALENLGASNWTDEMYRCEPVERGARITAYADYTNAQVLELARKHKVLGSQWEAFDARRLELQRSGVGFVAVLRHPVERACSWMAYARPAYSPRRLAGFVERRKDNPMVRMFSALAASKARADQACVAEALAVLARFDAVLLQEHLQAHMPALAAAWGWRRVDTALRVNARPDRPANQTCREDVLAPSELARVRAHLSLDLQLYHAVLHRALDY
jgi:hypothetical protein